MNSSNQAIAPVSALPPALPAPTDMPPQGSGPLRKAHELLRGRYLMAVLVGLVSAAAGAGFGLRILPPVYTSTGAILIKPSIPKILYQLEEHDAPRMFDEYVDAQEVLMSSPRVIAAAMGDNEWSSLGRGLTPESTAKFTDSLKIERDRRSHVVHLSFTDRTDKIASKGLKVVIRAYKALSSEIGDPGGDGKKDTLEGLKRRLNLELQDLRDRFYDVDKTYSPDALRRMWEFKLEEMKTIADSLKETQIALVTAGAVTIEEDSEGNDIAEDPTFTVEEIAARDVLMRSYVSRLQMVDSELAERSPLLGENHRNVKILMAIRQELDRVIQAYKTEYEANPANSGGAAVGRAQLATASIPELRVRQKVLLELRDQTREEMQAMSRSIRLIDEMEQRIAARQEQLEQVDQRLEEIRVEMNSSVSGRIEVISGLLPMQEKPGPSNSGTRIQIAVAGFGFGGSGGVALIMLVGLLDRRIRNSDDAHRCASDVKMLGVLPGLPKDLTDPEHAAVAGYCVHYIRTLLQLGSSPGDKKVLAVTSPSSGTGKTSLTLALGLSFATSGSRTLLVDCDLAGGGLTSRLNAIIRRRVGQILQRQGLVTAEQLAEALTEAERSGRRLGETLVARGVLQQHDLSAALATQEETQIGLLDALDEEPFDNCVAETGTPSLHILPIGGAQAHDMSRLSPSTVRHVIDEARKRFDTILLDTGPVPGAIETSIVATEADEVVLVVARGDDRGHADRAIRFLESIGGTLAGLVFNRAAPRDVARSVAAASLNASSNNDRDDASRGSLPSGRQQYDPVAQAVARTSRGSGDTS